MTYEEYQTNRQAILDSPDCTEIDTKPKMEDEYGVQYPIAKVDYVSSVGTLTHEFTYEGDTRNFTLQGVSEYLTIDGIRTDEVLQGV